MKSCNSLKRDYTEKYHSSSFKPNFKVSKLSFKYIFEIHTFCVISEDQRSQNRILFNFLALHWFHPIKESQPMPCYDNQKSNVTWFRSWIPACKRELRSQEEARQRSPLRRNRLRPRSYQGPGEISTLTSFSSNPRELCSIRGYLIRDLYSHNDIRSQAAKSCSREWRHIFCAPPPPTRVFNLFSTNVGLT